MSWREREAEKDISDERQNKKRFGREKNANYSKGSERISLPRARGCS
jgi:hypothetical protein